MQVLKFGGSSVGTAAGIEQVKNILKNRKDGYIVVVSALGGVTDGLKELLEESLEHLPTLKLTRLKERHFSLIKDLELLEDEILVSSIEDLFLEIENSKPKTDVARFRPKIYGIDRRGHKIKAAKDST